jgi:hypothetical protein
MMKKIPRLSDYDAKIGWKVDHETMSEITAKLNKMCDYEHCATLGSVERLILAMKELGYVEIDD